MATYTVTTVVTCADAAEWASFKEHLVASGVTVADPAPFSSLVLQEAQREATLVRVQQVNPPSWS